MEEGERAHPRSCPRSRKSSRYGQGPYDYFDKGGRSGQRHLPALLGEWLPRRCVPEGRPVPAWLVRPVMQEAGRMPLPRGLSFISAVIQAAPAVMPFTIQAAPAVMPATTGVHSLRCWVGKKHGTGGGNHSGVSQFLSRRFDVDVGAAEIPWATPFEHM